MTGFSADVGAPMSTKEKILAAMLRLQDDATYDHAIYRLELLKALEEGLRDVEAGKVMDHDEFFDSILNDDGQNTPRLVRKGAKKSPKHKGVHRQGGAKNGSRIHQKAKRVGR